MTRPPTHDMEMTCPFCGKRNDAVTADPRSDKYYPDDGDASICFNCGKVSIFDSDRDGGSRKPTPDEQRQLDKSEELQRILALWKVYRHQQ